MRVVLEGAGLSQTVLADRTTPQAHLDGKPNEAMGLGWEVLIGPPDDPIILLHTGSDEGIKTMILSSPPRSAASSCSPTGDRGVDVIGRLLHSSLNMKELDQ